MLEVSLTPRHYPWLFHFFSRCPLTDSWARVARCPGSPLCGAPERAGDAPTSWTGLVGARGLLALARAGRSRHGAPNLPSYIVGMQHELALSSISDDELIRRLLDVLQQSRRVEADLIVHIGEVDARRLYA